MNERRKERRVSADLTVVIKAGKRTIEGTMVDASFRGMFVATDDPPNLRQLVQIDAPLPGGGKFNAHMSVIHHGGARKGAGLELFGKGDHPEWEAFVKAQMQKPAPAPPAGPLGGLPLAPDPGGLPRMDRSSGLPMMDRSSGLPMMPPGPQLTPSHGVSVPPNLGGLPMQGGGLPMQGGGLPMQPGLTPSHGTASPYGSFAPPPASPSMPPPAQGAPPPEVLAAARGTLRTGAPYGGAERRRGPRVAMMLELRLRTPRSIHVAHTLDISMIGSGLLVADCAVQIGEQVIVNLIQPGTTMSFRRDGLVRRITPITGAWSHLGVDFAGLDGMREVLFANFMNTAYATLHPGG